MDLQDQFASMVHGVKNQLQLLGPSIDDLCANESVGVKQAGATIGTALDEINHQLVLMLSLYRLEDTSLFSTEEVHLIDILETACRRINDVRIKVDCNDSITLFCDERLVTAVVGDALHNAIRYSKNRIHVSARAENGGVVICIEDDGNGIKGPGGEDLTDQAQSEISTGLGTELARRVAHAHRRGDRHGSVSLDCSRMLGGAKFCLFLP